MFDENAYAEVLLPQINRSHADNIYRRREEEEKKNREIEIKRKMIMKETKAHRIRRRRRKIAYRKLIFQSCSRYEQSPQMIWWIIPRPHAEQLLCLNLAKHHFHAGGDYEGFISLCFFYADDDFHLSVWRKERTLESNRLHTRLWSWMICKFKCCIFVMIAFFSVGIKAWLNNLSRFSSVMPKYSNEKVKYMRISFCFRISNEKKQQQQQ